MHDMTEIQVYTDGSCLGNPGPGGWACIIRDGDQETEKCGSEPVTTNNRMELMAAIQALSALSASPRSRPVALHSDSQLLVKTMTLGWKRKTNQDLWAELDRLSALHPVRWIWVRGHDGHAENERCDRLAQRAAQAASLASAAKSADAYGGRGTW
jgi:ribonuclease HI